MSEGLTLTLFTAPGCVPCVPAKATLKRLIDAGLVTGAIVDVTVKPALAARFDVQSVPTLVVQRDGQVLGVHIGTKVVEYLTALERELTHGSTP